MAKEREFKSINVVSVARVIDGDTLVLNLDLGFSVYYQVTVRLNGLDTPEKNTPEGKKVKAEIEAWLKDKQLIIHSLDIDKYGRSLAEVLDVSGVSLNQHLLNKGFARKYDGGRKQDWTADLIDKIMAG